MRASIRALAVVGGGGGASLWAVSRLAASLALCVLATGGSVLAAGAVDEPLPRVLFLTHSAGYEHGVVKRPLPDELSIAEAALVAASAGRFAVTATQDCSVLTADGLEGYDAVVFYTTGELPVAPEDRDVLLEWVAAGGAFVGLHCASDTFYEYPAYLEMVGGTFDGHPWHEELTLDVVSGDHPATGHLDGSWTLTDELYQFREFRPEPLRVLLELDMDSVDASKGKREDGRYAVAWWREYGEGRVVYSALGHRPELWEDAAFLEHVLGALGWVIAGPDLPAPAPEGAVVLMGPTGFGPLDTWSHRGGKPFAWIPLSPRDPDGRIDALAPEFLATEVAPGTGDLVSHSSFGDALIHVEFATPHEPDDEGQARGNSGVYVQGRYEVQVLDSHEQERGLGTCGAIYGQHVAAVDATRPPERWQAYDILFTAPRFDEDGAKTASARMTVWHNGLLIHDDVEVGKPTLAGLADDEVPTGPLLLQDHGDRVRYRNVWVLPTDR